MKRVQWLSLLALVITLSACDPHKIYEDVYDFEAAVWNMDTIPEFEFNIEDSQPKRILLNVRNTIDFKSQNLYLTYYLLNKEGAEIKSELINIQLFDPITGKPSGKGNSIFQHEVEILPSYTFPKTGVFKIRVAQYMREADLQEIPSVGIRVEETSN
ncbi:gliding motility lipoprotein GldH [Roseivirga sp.]|uniref:gliding motility lipoprotein GldH n=1 Tax=Roseivirga sp. TaxID=1964215 RepID=UPI002B269F57|nr:gliding motility lipoprotein GldH [Roseivirga sp.]